MCKSSQKKKDKKGENLLNNVFIPSCFVTTFISICLKTFICFNRYISTKFSLLRTLENLPKSWGLENNEEEGCRGGGGVFHQHFIFSRKHLNIFSLTTEYSAKTKQLSF